MVILHIANNNNVKTAGPNINVPKNIIYGNKYAQVGLYNLRNSELVVKLPKANYFSISEYKDIDDLPVPYNNPDIVIFQEVYYLKYCFIARKLRKKGIPYIIVPRCSMTSAALSSKMAKKKIANILMFNRFISNARFIQFLTENEYKESIVNFRINDYYILGNGIEMPSKKYQLKNRKNFKIVFIARYNIYHKGLDVLLKSVNDNILWFRSNNVTVNLYGSDYDNGLKYMEKFVFENNLNDVVVINGPVYDFEKEKVLLDSDIFIHTSRLEGQPTSVIEAISYGIPVVVTPGTNIVDVVKKQGLGFTCKFDSNSIFDCIKYAYESKSEFENISCNEIKYAEKNFNWDSIIMSSIKLYEKEVLRGNNDKD